MTETEGDSARGLSVWFVLALSLCNGVATSATQITLSLYALKLGATAFAVGALAATFSIFPMLLAIAAGRMVDRFGARWPMIIGASCSALGLLVPAMIDGVAPLYAVGTLCGISIIFFNLSNQNLVGLLSTPRNRARNFANYMLTTSTATLVAPILAGYSIEHASYVATLVGASGLMMLCIAMLLAAGQSIPRGTGKIEGSKRSGLSSMLVDPAVRRLLAVGSLVNAGLNMFQVYLPVYAHSIGISASSTGLIVATSSAAAFIVRFSLPWLLRSVGEARILSISFILSALTLAAIPLCGHPAILMGTAFLLGLGSGCGQPIVIMMMFANSVNGRSGEALGLKFTTNQLTKLLAPLGFGAIASAAGLLPMFWINALLMMLGSYLARPRVPSAEETR